MLIGGGIGITPLLSMVRPPAMLDALEDALTRVGVPAERIHTERYSFVD